MKPIARDLSDALATFENPISIIDGRPLSNTVGSVLDPVMSLRRTCTFLREKPSDLVFSTIVASTREDVLNLADKYRDAQTFERTRTLAWTQAQVQMHHLGISTDEAQLFQRLANAVLYPDADAAAESVCSERYHSGSSRAVGAGNFRRPADCRSRGSMMRTIST